MKINHLFLIVFIGISSYGQSEFKMYDNGLIYSEASVSKLKHIVDSLNLKFKVCDVNKVYLSKNQTKANYIQLDKGKILEAKKDMENNISYLEFKKKYSKAKFEEKLLLIKSNYIDYDDKNITSYTTIQLGERQGNSIRFESDDSAKEAIGNWIIQYNKKDEYSDESIVAFYLLEKFQSKPLLKKYSRLIQYSDCLVDTTANVFIEKAKGSGIRYYDTLPNKAKKFNVYLEKALKRPLFNYELFDDLYEADTAYFDKPSKKITKKLTKKEKAIRDDRFKNAKIEQENFYDKYQKWESLRLSRLDSLKINDVAFMPMLNDAYIESKSINYSDDAFEEYVGLYISKEAELELKRNRRVVGGCSMDNRPRVHAFNIALLSAETTKWEIFLRSHLDIMNDRFDRVSDGSWAQEGRSTYIKELEILDINILDLILGISLSVENPAENHYFGSINRIGRALSESENKSQIETTILQLIADENLDDYNRVLMYYLFDNYNYNLKDENSKKSNSDKLKLAVSTMPDYIASKI
ncbi:MAG: hypothetical protein V4548_01905 [Bacteroidota bacterium]